MRLDFARAQRAGFKAVKSARYLPRQPHVILNEVKNLLHGGKRGEKDECPLFPTNGMICPDPKCYEDLPMPHCPVCTPEMERVLGPCCGFDPPDPCDCDQACGGPTTGCQKLACYEEYYKECQWVWFPIPHMVCLTTVVRKAMMKCGNSFREIGMECINCLKRCGNDPCPNGFGDDPTDAICALYKEACDAGNIEACAAYEVCKRLRGNNPKLNCVRSCIAECLLNKSGPCGDIPIPHIPFCELCCYNQCDWPV